MQRDINIAFVNEQLANIQFNEYRYPCRFEAAGTK
jgi:hypothetical protein